MNSVEMSDLFEIMCRNYYQVWVSIASDPNHTPLGFGSGFMILRNGHLYYVTADHVVNASNESFKLNIDKDYIANIPTNKVDYKQLCSEQVYFSIDKTDEIYSLKIDDKGDPILDDRIDAYYRNLDEHLHTLFLTQGLIFSEDDIRYKGLQKVIITEENMEMELNREHTFSVFGMKECSIQNGITVSGESIFHNGMTFKEEKGGQYCLEVGMTDENLGEKDWAGLSGSAVFDETTGKVIGMALRYSPEYGYCWVMPIRQILNFIDIDIDLRSKKHLENLNQ